MSIITKTGDKGATRLMFNRHVSKTDPRLEAYGTVDELNAALGLARATAAQPATRQTLQAIQKDLIILMGELATLELDRARYRRAGYSVVTGRFTARLEKLAGKLESRTAPFRGWAMPGDNPHSAALELARAICRRAERRACALREAGQLSNPQVIIYLNRLSDLLWLLARHAAPA
jgi:cob(I)alamin adenosyltransferase